MTDSYVFPRMMMVMTMATTATTGTSTINNEGYKRAKTQGTSEPTPRSGVAQNEQIQ
jgi:hypothetical protein